MIRHTLTAAVVVLGLVGSAAAEDELKNKNRTLARLFAEPAATASGSTVRIRLDNRDVALGTIVGADGFILTKGSEIRKENEFKPESISVHFRDGSAYDADVIGYHESTDLALLKIDASDLVPVTFTSSKFAEAGNMVAVVNFDSEPLAAGIISAGVRKLAGAERVIRNGNKGMLGIRMDPNREKDGIFVAPFDRDQMNSPAQRAKILAGDQIVSIDERPINSFEDLTGYLDRKKPGDKVKVVVRRKAKDSEEYEELTIEVKLGSEADMDRGAMQNRMGSALSGRRTGFPKVITTDLVVSPNDCGGPLVDLEGRVLGITIARAGRVESWVLPEEVITPVLADLKANKFPVKKP